MKRFGNLYGRICSYDNLVTAFNMASRNKKKRPEVTEFASNLEANLSQIQKELIARTYKTSKYQVFIKKEPKEREIYKLPFRDRVVHWAIMLVMEEIWVKQFTRDTYACIKKRGIHPCLKKLQSDLRNDPEGTTYCLKLDIRKFYPSIDHEILKQVIRKKVKDADLLWLLDEIIDSADGVPIGNYLSQFYANIYLSELDHLLKEDIKVKYYYRYADDLVILSHSKEELSGILIYINHYVHEFRNLDIKHNYQIFPVEKRGIDFIGYHVFHTHTLLRKRIKQNMCRTISRLNKRDDITEDQFKQRVCSWYGWMKHCNSKNLIKSIGMMKFSELKAASGNLTGTKLHIDQIIGKVIRLKNFEISDSKFRGNLLTLQYEIFEQMVDLNKVALTNEDGSPKMGWVEHISFTGSEALMKQLANIDPKNIVEPVEAKIIKQRIGDKDKFFYKMVDPDAE